MMWLQKLLYDDDLYLLLSYRDTASRVSHASSGMPLSSYPAGCDCTREAEATGTLAPGQRPFKLQKVPFSRIPSFLAGKTMRQAAATGKVLQGPRPAATCVQVCTWEWRQKNPSGGLV